MPAGVFHRVSCDDNEGSTSINFSISTTSYAGLVIPAIHSLLALDPKWREPISDDKVVEALASLLEELPRRISRLKAPHLVVPLLVDREANAGLQILDAATWPPCQQGEEFERNPLASLLARIEDGRLSNSLERELSIKFGAEIPSGKVCPSCSGDAGVVGDFCRWCGTKLPARKSLSFIQPHSPKHTQGHPVTFEVYVMPMILGELQHPLSRAQLQVPIEMVALCQQLASTEAGGILSADRCALSPTADIVSWRKLLGVLEFVGYLVRAEQPQAGGQREEPTPI